MVKSTLNGVPLQLAGADEIGVTLKRITASVTSLELVTTVDIVDGFAPFKLPKDDSSKVIPLIKLSIQLYVEAPDKVILDASPLHILCAEAEPEGITLTVTDTVPGLPIQVAAVGVTV